MAHGGHCVARLGESDGGRVVFVRHTLPGERVVIAVTEGTEGDRFWRADAVEVLTAAPDRVPAPCPYAGPGRCGGCDLQHVSLPRQRSLKADVVREQLSRLAGLDVEVEVEAVEGDDDGLRWRTRQRYVRLPGGRRRDAPAPLSRGHRGRRLPPGRPRAAVPRGRVRRCGHARLLGRGRRLLAGPPRRARGPGLAVLDALAPRPGDRALDLYAGVGLFARFLLDAVGATGKVVAVEADRRGLPARPGQPARPPGSTRSTGRLRQSWPATSPPPPRRPRPAAHRCPSGGRRADRGARAAGGRLCRLRPGRPGPRRRHLRRARLPLGRSAGLRPLPDDFPRGGRCASCEKRLWPAVM